MENEDIKKLHSKLLLLLKMFHKICADNCIKYSLYAGTLIGAVREKGFIKWDDDVDVAMNREEYEKLCEVIKSMVLPDDIKFDMYGNKITRFLHYDNGKLDTWIDIFIYDYISENVFFQKLKFLILGIFTALTKTKDTMEYTRYVNAKNKTYLFLCSFIYQIGKIFNQKTKIKLMHSFAKNIFIGKKTMIHRSNDRLIGIIYISPKEHMEEYMFAKFEDTELMITKNYNEILTATYGDYMTPNKQNTSEAHTKYRDAYNANKGK